MFRGMPFGALTRAALLFLFSFPIAVLPMIAAQASANAFLVPIGGSAIEIKSVYSAAGGVFLSLPEISTALKLKMTWQARTEKIVIRARDSNIVLSPGMNHVAVGGKVWRLNSPPRYIQGTVYVPLEFVQRALPIIGEVDVSVERVHPDPAPVWTDFIKKSKSIRRVVLDPGHGGHDAGARSPQGINEKDINLAIALKLRDRLEKEFGIEVIMTRDADYFIPLSGRTKIGNRGEADLFLCIHANGSVNRSATGLETYFLAIEATDRQAAKIAEEENQEALRFDPESPFAKIANQDDLKTILVDMVSAENMKASEFLAEAVQRRLVQTLRLPNRGVKQACFFVLVGSSIPAILVETGFVSNPEEAQRLSNPEVQDEIADALFDALEYYDSTLNK
jgi:N-acetylmuramoyl-L-alanine amidase